MKQVIEKYLSITDHLEADESVNEYKYDNYEPAPGSTLNGTIQILIQNQDKFYLPSKSFLIVRGKLIKSDGTALADTDVVTLVNNGIMFLFRQVEYRLGNREIESFSYPGHATLMKGLLSYPDSFEKSGLNMCWTLDNGDGNADINSNSGFKTRHAEIITDGKGYFSFLIPLSHIFGFCEDYNKVIYGVQHQLTLTRDSNDENAIHKTLSTLQVTVELTNITWYMINITPRDEERYSLIKQIDSKSNFEIGFRQRCIDQLDVAPNMDFTWKLGSRPAFEKPRYIIIGFQTNRDHNYNNAAVFDHCNVERINVELNSIRYPDIENSNNFKTHDYCLFYHLAKQFREYHYGLSENYNDFMISRKNFKTLYPLYVIDVSKQSEKLKDSIWDITIRAKFNEQAPAKTKCYCLMLSDRIMKLQSDGNRLVIEY